LEAPVDGGLDTTNDVMTYGTTFTGALALTATSVMGDCTAGANWITTDAGITNTGNTGSANAAYTGDSTWATCATIKAGASTCCTVAEVATFQTKATALVEELKTAVSTRDQFIMDRRGDVLAVSDSLNSIQSSITKIAADSSISVSDTLETFFTGYDDMISTFTEDFTALKAAFVTYQTNRQTCFNSLVQAQVSIWCAACLEAPADGGLDTTNDVMTYGTTFTGALASACSAYIASAIEQSEILSLYYVSDYLSTLATALEALANGDATAAATALTEFFTDYTAITTPSANLEKIAASVGTCTTTSCDWITTDLFNEGILVNDLAAVGGAYGTSRRLQQEVPAGRMLAALNVNPATDAAGITVDFPQNPGNVDNDQNSAVRNGAIACAITALAALL